LAKGVQKEPVSYQVKISLWYCPTSFISFWRSFSHWSLW